MKISRMVGLTALIVLALGQARADEQPVPGLGFGIVKEAVSPASDTVELAVWNGAATPPAPRFGAEGFLAVTDIEQTKGLLSPDKR